MLAEYSAVGVLKCGTSYSCGIKKPTNNLSSWSTACERHTWVGNVIGKSFVPLKTIPI